MNPLPPPTALEKVAGSPLTELALTGVGAAAGGVLAPLLPVLAKSLASGRQQKRIEAAIAELATLLQAHEEQVAQLTDEQYKLVNETILAVLHTTQQEKLRLLRHVVRNALTFPGLGSQEAINLSRIVRDISAQEVAFLLKAFQYKSVRIVEDAELQEPGLEMLRVARTSPEALCVSGLLSLGILAPGENSWGGIGSMMFSPITAKLIALLADT